MTNPAVAPDYSVCQASRHKPYRAIHKGLRAAMMQALTRVGQADSEDRPTLLSALSLAEDVLDLCVQHQRHEHAFMHPALRERRPEALPSFEADHADLLAAERSLREQIEQLRDCREGAEGALYAFYLALSEHFAEHWRHMRAEETELTAAFWSAFSDAEILAIEARLVASIEPVQRGVFSQWMLQAANHGERLTLLQGMRAGMPAPAFEAMLEGLQRILGSTALLRLRRALAADVEGVAP